jgi:hypothetical protein
LDEPSALEVAQSLEFPADSSHHRQDEEEQMATPGGPDVPNPREKLVKVFDSDLESEVMVVRGLLESAGIETATVNLEAPQDILPGVGGVILQVREEQEAEARKVISDYSLDGEASADAAEAASEE